MADELNIPTHRWYQKRNHIALAKEDFSRQYIYDSGIQKIDAWINSQPWGDLDPYIVNGFSPELTIDFIEDYYRTGGSASTFDDALNFSRAGNATMVDSDGVLKWAPHNLLTYSDQFDFWNTLYQGSGASPTVTTNQWQAPDGSQTADRVEFSRTSTGTVDRSVLRALNVTTLSGATYKFRIWLKSFNGNSYDLAIYNNYAGGGGTIVTVTDTWKVFDFEDTATADSTTSQFLFGLGYVASDEVSADILVWGAHAYRSDLGGMVDNPATGNSYVPTTDSARYLPRVGNHVYNGTAWVKEGYLHEPEAATNFVTQSKVSNAYWLKQDVTLGTPITPNGLVLEELVEAVTNADHRVVVGVSITSGTTYTFSAFVKSGTRENIIIGISGGSIEQFFVAAFNTTTGLVTATDVGTNTGTIISTNSEDFGGGVYRVSVTGSLALSTGFPVINISNSDTPAINAFGQVVYLGDGSTLYAGETQLEVGSVPTSYTPTSGSEVQRTPDILTLPIENIPYPEPVVIGEELVTNGTFDTDTDWSKTNYIISNGSASTVSSASNPTLSQSIGGLVEGSLYEVKYTASVDTGSTGLFPKLGTIGNPTALSKTISATTPTEYSFITIAGASGILQFTNTTSASILTLDNISVREINPLAVSFGYKSLVTYADERQLAQEVFLNWDAGGGNRISYQLYTNGGNTGQVWFRQSADSVNDDIFSGGGAYSPSINVPMSLASRHGSTFINGAVDGTALTANTTPTAFPDLSTTDLVIAPSGGPQVIQEFIMWGGETGDIGEAGIEETSA